MNETLLNLCISALTSVLAFSVVIWCFASLKKEKEIDQKIQVIASYIRKGAKSFIRQQYIVAGRDIFIFSALLGLAAYYGYVSIYTPFAVFTGAFFSGLAAYIGMVAATLAGGIVSQKTEDGISETVKFGLRGAAVMGFVVTGFVLADLSLWYGIIYFTNPGLEENDLIQLIVSTVITFAFGSSYMAFRARVSGGIFTKAADFAADVVGKGEYKMDEDDPRNPAVIADNVGDNVSDVAGMGQDLNESYVGGNVAAMEAGCFAFENYAILLGVSISAAVMIRIPIAISCIGLIASMIGLLVIRSKSCEFKKLLNSFRKGVYLTSLLTLIGSFFLIYFTFGNLNFFWAVLGGLLVGNLSSFVSEYYTSSSNRPTKNVAKQATAGHPSVILKGTSSAYESSFVTALVVVVGMIFVFLASGGATDFNLGIYGISIAAVAMLSTLPITLTIDAFGPIADNAQGILEMSGIKGERAKIANSIDSLGNTTAATGKGYAISSAAFASVALLNALWHIVVFNMDKYNLPLDSIDLSITNIWIIAGLIIGIATPFLFVSKLLNSVNEAAFVLIAEIKKQLPKILSGEKEPNYDICIVEATKASQKGSIFPGIMVLVFPTVIWIFGGPGMAIAFLVSALGTSFLTAVFMANAGGSWDNAKKYIEAGNLGGKGSPAHDAAITGDMVGDPYKDTAGPSLNILIKLMITYSIMASGLLLNAHYSLF